MSIQNSFVEEHMAEFDAKLAVHLEDFQEQVNKIFDAAGVRLDVLEGKPVNLFRRVIAETFAAPTNQPQIDYGEFNRWSRPTDRIGSDYTFPKEVGIQEGLRKAAEVKGSFFEVRIPPWDFQPEGKDLIYVYDVEGAEYPNPTIHFISVDPESQVYGRPRDMTAADMGLRPCPYGNHSYTYPRPEMGRIDLPDLPTDIRDLAVTADVTGPELGLELLARAVEFGSNLPKAAPFEDVARFYGAHVVVYASQQAS